MALGAAERAEVVVLVMGFSPEVEGEEMPVRMEGFAAATEPTLACLSRRRRCWAGSRGWASPWSWC